MTGGRDSMPPSPAQGPKATQRPASVLQTLRAVAWSFLGIRRSSGLAQDVEKLNPVHVVVAGVVGAAAFVAVLVFFVKWVVGSGVAS